MHIAVKNKNLAAVQLLLKSDSIDLRIKNKVEGTDLSHILSIIYLINL
jgi:hypothetical protein